MTRRLLDRFEAKLENKLGLNSSNRPKFFQSIVTDKSVDFSYFGIRETRVSFGERYQLIAFPNSESVIGEQVRPFAASLLRIDENTINRQRIYLPFPPIAAMTADAVR